MKCLSHIFAVLLVWGVCPIWAAPEIAFSPATIDFDSLQVGARDSVVLYIKNVGDETLVVSGGALAKGDQSAFDVVVTNFQVSAGDSVGVMVHFEARAGGVLADVLTLHTNLTHDPLASRPVIQLLGIGIGPEIELNTSVLSFASQGIGASVFQNLFVRNRGNDTLRVADVFVQDVRFAVDLTTFALGPDQERIVRVSYTPDSSRARVDTVYVVSNDFDEDTLKVVLDAQETPQQVGDARITLSRNGVTFPQVGDTISVSVTLSPNSDSVGGVELFFGYDPQFFAPADTTAPFSRVGYAENRLNMLANKVVSKTGNLEVAHLSAFLVSQSDSITAEGLLTQVRLVVLKSLSQTTRLRVLVEAPLFNTQYITPAGLYFTMPASNAVSLGNTPPVIRPFPPLAMDEDQPANLALLTLATDAESGPLELQWSFEDPDSLVRVSVSTLDPEVGPIARFFPPANVSGTFAIRARVADPAGASDSSVVVVDVAPVNDSPEMPTAIFPGEGATGLEEPITLSWSAKDSDRGDVLQYDVRFGQNRLFLDVVAESIGDTTHTLQATLVANAVYFWQVVARDLAGDETESSVWQFSTAADTTPPTFVGGPEISEVTDTTAAVFWSLDEPASARIVLGLQASLSDSLDIPPIEIAGQSRLRTQELTGLTPGTQYHLQITLADAAGNTLVSDILSLTTTGQAPQPPVADDLGDFSGDRRVDFTDFIVFAAVFNKSIGDVEYIPNADFDSNGSINFGDFLVFASVFGNDYAASKKAP